MSCQHTQDKMKQEIVLHHQNIEEIYVLIMSWHPETPSTVMNQQNVSIGLHSNRGSCKHVFVLLLHFSCNIEMPVV